MTKNSKLAIVSALLAILPVAAMAAPATTTTTTKKPAAHAKAAVATTYKCPKCGMTFSAAEAKKNGYKCEMDGAKLVPVKTAAATKPTKSPKM